VRNDVLFAGLVYIHTLVYRFCKLILDKDPMAITPQQNIVTHRHANLGFHSRIEEELKKKNKPKLSRLPQYF
jgi:hypothetical protein